MMEVCIDSLESAYNAIKGGADELEICSSLVEGGLTPSPGLVLEIMKLVKSQFAIDKTLMSKPKVNVMIRCRGGSDFGYSDQEMNTMLADIEVYKSFGVDRFVFGALTERQEIDATNCARIIDKANPIPVTFHRAFDLCVNPIKAIEDIVALGFTRLLTSGQQISADNAKAVELLTFLLKNFSSKIEIMPGAGINCDNARKFVDIGFNIIHSSCKRTRNLPEVGNLCMGSNVVYVTDEIIVREMKKIIKPS
ncbi:copper homeostasis protein cutC homolog [Maniola jurtina]|uniref:copper homeostasis protein cutC homolog n=1 Tax=Maniola jurtina TaxID=191418 RepID=UPI001E68B7A4|nr:copper homeostasis protein cutC homolog [Maniola jurtina]